VEAFYYLLASSVVKQLGLPGAGGHMDSTSLHVDGKYNSRHSAPPYPELAYTAT
jgi:hypothetical protein